MNLSEKLENSLCDFIEAAREQEKLLHKKDKDIQSIVKECKRALNTPEIASSILETIIEEYEEDI